MQLQRPDLFRDKAFINGNWQPAIDGSTFAVRNPYDDELLAEVADLSQAETEAAIAAADRAFLKWSTRPALERAKILRRWYRLLLEHLDDLALLLTLEQGKPLSEARGEIRYGASFVEWFAEEAKRVYGDLIPATVADQRITVLKQPVGVVAAITPWNFPVAMVTRKLAPALAAGCTVVLKPAESTPLSALALAVLAEEAGLPAGVLNVLPTNQPEAVGRALTESSTVRKLSFTGSTAVGKQLMRQCAGTVKRLSLELGGNAPFIVFDDADLQAAVSGAIQSKYRNAGQTCICANRFYVQASIYDDFVARLATEVDGLKMGDGRAAGTEIGPLIDREALRKVADLVEEAKGAGARVVNNRSTVPEGCFYLPSVLTGMTTEMRISHEEIFGPVAPVFKFQTEREVIELANQTPYGLAAYFYGRDYARLWRVAEALEYGMVGINTGAISTAVAPFGGVKESGFGREGSKYGIEEYLSVKYVCWHQ